MTMTKKYSKKLTDLVVKAIAEEGLTIEAACKKYEELPTPRTIYRWQLKYKDFAEQLDKAHGVLFMRRFHEMDQLSSGLASDHYPNADFREAEAALKRRIDTIKFACGKMAPQMSKRFDKVNKVEVEHKGDVGPKFVIMNYSDQPTEKVVQDSRKLIDGDKDE
jgi:hypothetical protein